MCELSSGVQFGLIFHTLGLRAGVIVPERKMVRSRRTANLGSSSTEAQSPNAQ